MLPNFGEFSQSNHTLFIFEDCLDFIQSLPKEKITALCSFLKASRHQNASMLVVMHDFAYNKQRLSFERQFLEQCSLVVIFAFTVNKHQLRSFIQRIFGDKIFFKYFLEAFTVSKKVCNIDNSISEDTFFFKRPYVMISVDSNKYYTDPLLNMRIDLFKRNLTFQLGGN